MIYNTERPEVFSAVKGQEDTIRPLKTQCKTGNFAHAYLLTGHHGCGKTTVARILAKAANCKHPTEDGPCCECENCRGILKGSMDYVELDAASNNGVDDIRSIVESTKYVPAELKYKIFIIDEVHMLSTGAFNALLKTLEEPPEYVMFFLCTTEMHKVPKTIVSRCQIHQFRAIDTITIASALSEICDKYGYSYDMESLYLVAKAANGAMRDALSIFEQCIEGNAITQDVVKSVTGLSDNDMSFELINAVASNDVSKAIQVLQNEFETGNSTDFFLKSILEILADSLIYLREGSMEHIYNTSDYKSALEKTCSRLTLERAFGYINAFSEMKSKISKDSSPELFMQAQIIYLSVQRDKEDELKLLRARIEKLEHQLSEGLISVKTEIPSTELSEVSEALLDNEDVIEDVIDTILDDTIDDGFESVADESVPFESDASVAEGGKLAGDKGIDIPGFKIAGQIDLNGKTSDETKVVEAKTETVEAKAEAIEAKTDLSSDKQVQEPEEDMPYRAEDEFVIEDDFGFPTDW